MYKLVFNLGIKGITGFNKFEKREKRGEIFPAFQFISVTIDCNLAARLRIRKLQPKLIESTLVRSASMLQPKMIAEIRSFIVSKQTIKGGFADRSGKCDLYYTLFGYYLTEAFSVKGGIEPLRKYVKAAVTANNLKGVYLYCGAILYAMLIGSDSTAEKIRKEIVAVLNNPNSLQSEYSRFMGILVLYYLEDFGNI